MSKITHPTFHIFAFWRLSAALLISFYHFASYGPPFYNKISYELEALLPLLDMFFMISGFLIVVHYAERISDFASYKTFLLRRFARLYPLHFITLSFFCLVGLAVHFGFVDSGNPEKYALHELYTQIFLINAWGVSDVLSYNYVSWSLSAEWFCYILFPVIVITARYFGLIGLFVLLFIVIGLLEGLTALDIMPFPTWLEANTWGAYRAFADFVLGAIIALIVSKKRISMTAHWPVWLAYGITWAIMVIGFSSGYIAIAGIAVSMYLAATVEYNAPERSNYLKKFTPLANVSFGIYLWHPIIASILLALGWRVFLEPMDILPFGVVVIIAMIATIVIALVSAYFFEKPVGDWILSKTVRKKASSKQPKEQI